MNPGDTPDELEHLLMGLVEDDLSPEESERLAELLRGDGALRETYIDYLLLDSFLRWEPPDALPAPPPARRRRMHRRRPVGALAAALAAALLIGLGLWLRIPRPSMAVADAAEPTDDTVAVLRHTSGAVWADSSLPTRPGAPLPPGRMRLAAGVVHLEFYCGATVIVQGPAEFRLVSRARVDCSGGALWATVPPHAEGFTIGTPALDLVDRGTEFGVRVGGRGETEVHVFRGKVELYDAGAAGRVPPTRALTTGQGVRVGPAGAADSVLPDPAGFVTCRELEDKLSEEAGLRQGQWRAAADAWRDDPDLRVYLPFQEAGPGDRVLADRAGPPGPACDGAVVGCEWVAGRWPGRRALEFQRVSDRVRLHVPGEFASATLAAWVRLDGLPNQNNALVMADGWEEGEVHWQIGHDGTIILGVQGGARGRRAHYHARRAIDPSRFGQWVHLAVVYDAAGRRVTHYVDGRPVAAPEIRSDLPLRFGDTELGNWNVATYQNKSPVRYLSGRMDEFMLFARALGPEEVGRLYSQSRPPS